MLIARRPFCTPLRGKGSHPVERKVRGKGFKLGPYLARCIVKGTTAPNTDIDQKLADGMGESDVSFLLAATLALYS